MLYHQIHPAKLTVDISTSLLTTYFLWVGNLTLFYILFLAPSVVATFLLIKFVDLEPFKKSRFGKKLAYSMDGLRTALRAAGQVVAWVTAWHHSGLGVIAGFSLIIAVWVWVSRNEV